MQYLSSLKQPAEPAEEPAQVEHVEENAAEESDAEEEVLPPKRKRKAPTLRLPPPKPPAQTLVTPMKHLAEALSLQSEPQPFEDIVDTFKAWVKDMHPDSVSEDGKSFMSNDNVFEVCQAMTPGANVMFNFVGKYLKKLCK